MSEHKEEKEEHRDPLESLEIPIKIVNIGD